MDCKVILTYKDVDGVIAEESIWAESVGGNYYRVANIPFFAPNIAYNDVIEAHKDDGQLHFESLITASGHSTVQIVFFKKDNVQEVIRKLELQGCHWEEMKEGVYYSLDIPPHVNYYLSVKPILDIKRSEAILDYKEACLAQ